MKTKSYAMFFLLCALAASSLSSARTFIDGFQRATTSGQTKDSSLNAIGTEYTILSGKWNIGDASTSGRSPNYLVAAVNDGDVSPEVMYFNSFETLRSASNEFNISMDVWNGGYGNNNRRQGMVFNLQDINNYYVFEYEVGSSGSGVARLGIVNNGTYSLLDNLSISNAALDRNIYYKMSVTADASGISASLSSMSGTQLTSLSSNNTALLNGYAGFIRNSTASVGFDNFTITAVPEPSTVALAQGATVLIASLYMVRRLRR